jgi:hypothetical protein
LHVLTKVADFHMCRPRHTSATFVNINVKSVRKKSKKALAIGIEDFEVCDSDPEGFFPSPPKKKMKGLSKTASKSHNIVKAKTNSTKKETENKSNRNSSSDVSDVEPQKPKRESKNKAKKSKYEKKILKKKKKKKAEAASKKPTQRLRLRKRHQLCASKTRKKLMRMILIPAYL